MTAAEFAAIVTQVLASMPRVRIAPEDVDAAAADLAQRIVAVYPRQRQRPLLGMRAIIDAYGMDSSMGVRARFQMRLYEFGLRYRELRHRELSSLPAPLVEEPNMDAVAAELLELFKLRHRGVEARNSVAAAQPA